MANGLLGNALVVKLQTSPLMELDESFVITCQKYVLSYCKPETSTDVSLIAEAIFNGEEDSEL